MRQAGRYLPEYRAVREKFDFMTMCHTPELAAEVTVQPINRFALDAAIIFSDILVVPEAMGMKLTVIESQGPVFDERISSPESIDRLNTEAITDRLKYVYDAIKMTKERLENKVPLIGFAGSPWTLAAYMVEGKGSKNFEKIKSFIYNNPSDANKLLEKLANAVSAYLIGKIDAGCDAIQIFDTWAGILSPWDFDEFSLKYIKQIVNNIKHKNVPVIVFAKGINNYKKIVQTGCDVVGVDWTNDIGHVKKEIGSAKALQGNLDPVVLFSNTEKIKKEAARILESYGTASGHIFNLGHGILPNTPVENVETLVEFVRSKSQEYHLIEHKNVTV
jgi:uroporphyrinogen decarboxylase